MLAAVNRVEGTPMPPTIDTAANIVGALISALARKGVLSMDEADGIFDEAKAALGPFVSDDVMASSVQMIERLRKQLHVDQKVMSPD
jgi:hypothetical protein